MTALPPTCALSAAWARAWSIDGRPISAPWRISISVPQGTMPCRPRCTASGPAADPVAGSSATPYEGMNIRVFHPVPEPAKQFAHALVPGECADVGPKRRDRILVGKADVDVTWAVLVDLDGEQRLLDAERGEQLLGPLVGRARE